MNRLEQEATHAFEERFGGQPSAYVRAPGCVSLLGDQTVFFGGHSLSMAVNMNCVLAFRPNNTNTVLVEVPEPAHDTSIEPPALIEGDDGARGGQGEQDHLPVSEGPTPEPIAPTPDAPEPGDGCEFGQETAETNAGSAAEARGNDAVPVDPCAINRDAADTSLDQGQAREPGRPDDVPSDHREGIPASRP